MPATPAASRQTDNTRDPVAQMMAALLPVHRAVTIGWLADAAATAAERGLGAPFAFVYIEQQDGRLDYLPPASDLRRRSHERANAPFGGKLRRKLEPANSPLLADALETSSANTVSPAELYDDIDDVAAHAARKSLGVDRVALVPLETAGERIGAMAVFVARETDDELLRLLGDHVACAIANLRSAEAAREHGVTDVVRSVFDERKLERDLQRELSRTTRTRRPVSIVVLQATNLGLLREQYGKFLTDRLLQRLGEALAEHSRDIDIIGAYKDSGYTMVLSEAHSEGAAIAAKRLLEMAQQVHLDGGDVPGLELHLAAGWATCPSDGATTDSMFAAAEVRMYGAAA